jgi:glycosyltransferase involved in cell wall biosynthesis
MLVSTIIPTIGRATLSRAVDSVLQQHFRREECEVVVVNDSGGDLPTEEWQQHANVRIIATNRVNRSIARNTGATLAGGKYLHFLDDDDWLVPDAFQQLAKTADATPAGWICGGFGLVDNLGELIKEIYPPETGNCFIQTMASEWLPLQASWIDAEAFFEVGGFDPLFSTSSQDIDLSRKIARYHEFAHCPALTAKIRYGDAGSTTEYGRQILNNRLSREKNLDLPGAFGRLRRSALVDTNRRSYWQGRIVYFYVVSVVWNLKQKQPIRAANRTVYLLLALLTSGLSLFSPSLWEAVHKPHSNLVRRSLGLTGDKMYRNTVW